MLQSVFFAKTSFFASFDDYQISEEDTFINRPDSEAIGAAPVIEDNYKEADPNEPEQIVIPNSITFTGTIIDNVIESLVPIILVDIEENSGLSYDKVLFELTEEQKDWELKTGTRVQIVCSDIFQESTPPIGNLISITEAAPNDELKIADEAARAEPRQPSRPCFFPAITGRAAYPRRERIPLETARQHDYPGK